MYHFGFSLKVCRWKGFLYLSIFHAENLVVANFQISNYMTVTWPLILSINQLEHLIKKETGKSVGHMRPFHHVQTPSS